VTPEEIINKCKDMEVYLTVVDGKIKPIGKITKEFLELSKQFAPFKESLKEYLTAALQVFKSKNVDSSLKIKRLQNNCKYLGKELERPAGCNCNGKVIYACAVFGKCKRVGLPMADVKAICTECDRYEA